MGQAGMAGMHTARYAGGWFGDERGVCFIGSTVVLILQALAALLPPTTLCCTDCVCDAAWAQWWHQANA
jgi:hypothetical protein